MRRVWLLAALVLVPLVAAQDAPLPALPDAPALPAAPSAIIPAPPAQTVAVSVPGVANASVATDGGSLLPQVNASLDPALAVKLPPLPLKLRLARNWTLAGSDADPFLRPETRPLPAPVATPTVVRADAPRPPSGGRDPSGPPGPGPVVGLMVEGPPTPLAASPVTAAVALGVTALLAAAARLYSRFGRDEVAGARPRALLCDALARQPGASVAELARATGMSRGAVVHHAWMLERHGVVASRHDGLHRRFWMAGQRQALAQRPATPAQARVLDALQAHGPQTQAELAARLGVTVQAASYHLRRLRRDERVEARVAEGERRWAAIPRRP